jgi:hypothetical protein
MQKINKAYACSYNLPVISFFQNIDSSCDHYCILNHIRNVLMNDVLVNVDPSYYGVLACPSGSSLLFFKVRIWTC